MEQATDRIAEQVREVVETAMDALRVPPPGDLTPIEAARSYAADVLRAEMIDVGRKLWQRSYVDGNGGNISVRLGPDYVLCTPTLMSKGDLKPADFCLSDLAGNIVAGDRPRTSELLLHLEIYKAEPRARAVVHCHPPYATAFAVTGSAPPAGYISEYEIFIGPAAVAPYETPGTQAFAESILPFVHDHNAILLANHGVVCWADTATHAEWLVEVLDTYCKTYLIAQQIGKPLVPISDEKIREILAIKRRLGLPDARMSQQPAPKMPQSSPNEELNRLAAEAVARLERRET